MTQPTEIVSFLFTTYEGIKTRYQTSDAAYVALGRYAHQHGLKVQLHPAPLTPGSAASVAYVDDPLLSAKASVVATADPTPSDTAPMAPHDPNTPATLRAPTVTRRWTRTNTD